jgi:adenosine deaminase
MPLTDGPAGPAGDDNPGAARGELGPAGAQMATLARNSFDACFAPDEAKKRWKAEVYDFAARNAPVAG